MEKLYTIYMHKSPNGKVYIGKTCQYLSARFGKDGRKYKYNKAFFYDISFYGWNAFSHIALEKNLTKDIADERERYFIEYYQANNPDYGYNLQTGGSSDFSQSDATRNKIKLFNKGKKLTDLILMAIYQLYVLLLNVGIERMEIIGSMYDNQMQQQAV